VSQSVIQPFCQSVSLLEINSHLSAAQGTPVGWRCLLSNLFI